jgi:hypothetical protein
MPCTECGAAVDRAERDAHVCDPDRLVDYRMFQLRDEIADVEDELGAFFDSPEGRFELWRAERERRRRG